MCKRTQIRLIECFCASALVSLPLDQNYSKLRFKLESKILRKHIYSFLTVSRNKSIESGFIAQE